MLSKALTQLTTHRDNAALIIVSHGQRFYDALILNDAENVAKEWKREGTGLPQPEQPDEA